MPAVAVATGAGAGPWCDEAGRPAPRQVNATPASAVDTRRTTAIAGARFTPSSVQPRPRGRAPGPEARGGYRCLALAACHRRSDVRASAIPTPCGVSSGRRRANQPIRVNPARRGPSGTVGSRMRRAMSAMRRARALSSAGASSSGSEPGSLVIETIPFAESVRDTCAQAYPAFSGRRVLQLTNRLPRPRGPWRRLRGRPDRGAPWSPRSAPRGCTRDPACAVATT